MEIDNKNSMEEEIKKLEREGILKLIDKLQTNYPDGGDGSFIDYEELKRAIKEMGESEI